jgi:renalase
MATPSKVRQYAVIGAGIAGLACARTLERAGHRVTLYEKNDRAGGRMLSVESAFGAFDTGTQYFTVRDPRFAQALATAPGAAKRWSANAVRVLDAFGQVAEAALPGGEAHWVGVPTMDALAQAWAAPLVEGGAMCLAAPVLRIEPDALAAGRWQLRVDDPLRHTEQCHSGFDAVLLAVPAGVAQLLLRSSGLLPAVVQALDAVRVAPCWSMMLAFPQAQQAGLASFGPQWNAARSTHHRLAWLCRESSKPGRVATERWTGQASAEWSQEHLEDDPARVLAKLQRAFAEVTGIHAQPIHAEVRLWRHAQTLVPLGKTHIRDAGTGIGLAGDWCLGHRVEDAFVSGLELALAAR